LPLLRAGGNDFNCQAVLFDKDGTLIDFKYMWLEWSRYVVEQVAAVVGLGSLQRGMLEQSMGIDLAAWYVDPQGPLAGGSMTAVRESMLQMLQTTGLGEYESGAVLRQVLKKAEDAVEWEKLAEPVPGLHELLPKLRERGLKLAVVTADASWRARTSLTALQLIDCFDVVVGADHVEKSKPAPDMALLACRILGVEPGRAVVVGDTPRDIMMAKDAGAGSVGVLSGVSTREQFTAAQADAIIGSVAELAV